MIKPFSIILRAILPNPQHAMPMKQLVFGIMASIFVSCLVIANLTGAFLINLPLPWGGNQLISGGILTFPITFLLTDMINEFYGEAGAKQITWLGFVVVIGFSLLFQLLLHLPVSPITVISLDTFTKVIAPFTNMIQASLIAYVVGQFLDIGLFRVFKHYTGNKYLWVRATGSTLVSQLFDSFIVTFVAFWGTLSVEQMVAMGQGNYSVKVVAAILITPLLYLGHRLVFRLLGEKKAEAIVAEADEEG